MMEVQSLAAQHSFVHRIVCAAFDGDPALFIFVYSETTAYAAVTAGGEETFGVTGVDRHKWINF
jgi:hypothetical protein